MTTQLNQHNFVEFNKKCPAHVTNSYNYPGRCGLYEASHTCRFTICPIVYWINVMEKINEKGDINGKSN